MQFHPDMALQMQGFIAADGSVMSTEQSHRQELVLRGLQAGAAIGPRQPGFQANSCPSEIPETVRISIAFIPCHNHEMVASAGV
jgi:hypothetical protein